MPYLDFKKSPLFSNCYNYGPPQMPPHLPFIPFGYHGMMNLAVAGSQLAALQRRGDELQRFTMAGVRPHTTDSGTPSQRYSVFYQHRTETDYGTCLSLRYSRIVANNRFSMTPANSRRFL